MEVQGTKLQGTELQILSFNMSSESIQMTVDIDIPLSSAQNNNNQEETPSQKGKLLQMLEDCIQQYTLDQQQLQAEIGVKARDLISASEEKKMAIQKQILSYEKSVNLAAGKIKGLNEYIKYIQNLKTIDVEQELLKVETERESLLQELQSVQEEEDLAQVEANTLQYTNIETQETETKQAKWYASAAYVDILQHLVWISARNILIKGLKETYVR